MIGRSNAVSGGGFTNSLKIINNTNYKFPLEANPGEFVSSEPSVERLEFSISTRGTSMTGRTNAVPSAGGAEAITD